MHIGPTFTVEREVVRARVFTSSIRPPTMSMEDWGDIVTAKREAREERERLQSAGRVRSLRELAETGENVHVRCPSRKLRIFSFRLPMFNRQDST